MLSSKLVLYITCSKNKVTSWKKEQKECKSWCGLRRYGENIPPYLLRHSHCIPKLSIALVIYIRTALDWGGVCPHFIMDREVRQKVPPFLTHN